MQQVAGHVGAESGRQSVNAQGYQGFRRYCGKHGRAELHPRVALITLWDRVSPARLMCAFGASSLGSRERVKPSLPNLVLRPDHSRQR